MVSQSSYEHQVTPFPSEESITSFPFPVFTKPAASVASSSKSLSYAQPHAISHKTAHFALPTIYSPVPPSLMHRRTSSSSTMSSVSSASTASWGNSVVNSPPMLSRSGSSSSTFSSRRGSIQSPALRTPEMSSLDSFDEEPEIVKGNKALRFSPHTLCTPIFPTLGRPISPARIASSAKPELKAPLRSAMAPRPRLMRQSTPIPSQPIVSSFTAILPAKPKSTPAPVPQRPKLVRQVTPHPEHNEKIDLNRSEVRSATKRASENSVLEKRTAKMSIMEEEEEEDSDIDEEEVEVESVVRGRSLSRSPVRKFSSIISGQMWVSI